MNITWEQVLELDMFVILNLLIILHRILHCIDQKPPITKPDLAKKKITITLFCKSKLFIHYKQTWYFHTYIVIIVHSNKTVIILELTRKHNIYLIPVLYVHYHLTFPPLFTTKAKCQLWQSHVQQLNFKPVSIIIHISS